MRSALTALSFFSLFGAAQVQAQDAPVVVELYTSQGCSSCPPADELLHDLAKMDGIIALALHVDYWDYIGWKDSFASPAFTDRQHAYAHRAAATFVYTPQMVVNGHAHVVASRAMEVMATINDERGKPAVFDVDMSRQGDVVTVTAPAGRPGDYVVQLARYTPQETVSITRGENAGRELSYANIVTSLDPIGPWDGRAPLNMQADVTGDGGIVVLIQENAYGPIVGAAKLPQ